jgi:hypothetical protein
VEKVRPPKFQTACCFHGAPPKQALPIVPGALTVAPAGVYNQVLEGGAP